MAEFKNETGTYEMDVGNFEIFFRKRYNLLSILNDLSLGVWFTVGSILFFWSATQTFGTALFVLGSLQLLGRPVLKLVHALFMKRSTQRIRNSDKPSD
ncbi:YrhK family protein [Salinicoccus sesuvii]|uniref:YrhK family protein n=1 Tax=Salinicoccus sesuvii TaxID=868281 RepID=A0ABV7N0F1_9STAP